MKIKLIFCNICIMLLHGQKFLESHSKITLAKIAFSTGKLIPSKYKCYNVLQNETIILLASTWYYTWLDTNHMHCISCRLLCWSPSFVNNTAVFSAKATWISREWTKRKSEHAKEKTTHITTHECEWNSNYIDSQNLISLQHALNTFTINITISKIHTPSFISKCSSSNQITSMLQYPTLLYENMQQSFNKFFHMLLSIDC